SDSCCASSTAAATAPRCWRPRPTKGRSPAPTMPVGWTESFADWLGRPCSWPDGLAERGRCGANSSPQCRRPALRAGENYKRPVPFPFFLKETSMRACSAGQLLVRWPLALWLVLGTGAATLAADKPNPARRILEVPHTNDVSGIAFLPDGQTL